MTSVRHSQSGSSLPFQGPVITVIISCYHITADCFISQNLVILSLSQPCSRAACQRVETSCTMSTEQGHQHRGANISVSWSLGCWLWGLHKPGPLGFHCCPRRNCSAPSGRGCPEDTASTRASRNPTPEKAKQHCIYQPSQEELGET